jgi:hypothetical protein
MQAVLLAIRHIHRMGKSQPHSWPHIPDMQTSVLYIYLFLIISLTVWDMLVTGIISSIY